MDPSELKKIGIIQQKQKGLYAMRLRTVGGDLLAVQLKKVAEVSERYADGEVHLSTRQGVELHNVKQTDLAAAQKELELVGIKMGACGPRVRVIVACPGKVTCRWGVIDTKELAKKLDAKYFRKDTPHKFKLAVTGCPHNCAKATENDIGIMGGILPKWEKVKCIDCDLCVNVCPTKAIYKKDDEYKLDKKKCILCPICTASCPTNSWVVEKKGYSLFIGGTMGKQPRLATRVPGLIEDNEELMKLADRAVELYKKYGRKKERFGHLIDRIGVKKVIKEITDGV
ncbi:MAG: 4Fe-4S dicluster domain-containing protein [Candidatus Omnitrophota bacterium]